MRRTLIVSSFLLVNLSITIAAAALLMIQSTTKSLATQQYFPESANPSQVSYGSYSALPEVNSEQTSVEIVPADGRGILIDNFFHHYRSPMQGLGTVIAQTADKYSLPFGLLPAIAQCEGNLGKVMPQDSYNTWGWATYGDKVHKFTSWQDGIEKVSKGLRKNYFDKGLNKPADIMRKYTPSSDGSWADCVAQFLEELK